MTTKEFFISKLTFREDERLIKDVFLYEYDGKNLNEGETKDRDWMVQQTNSGYQISVIHPNINDKEKWMRGNNFSYDGNYFRWEKQLPLNITRRKTFVSYYHHDDQQYKEKFESQFRDIIVSKSVQKDDIDSDNSDQYIKQLIQKGYLSDTTVLVVLIGSKTKCRMHVDWEISGALNLKVGEKYSGLLGLILPNHPDYGTEKATYDLMPARLADNFKSGYAVIRDWTEDRVKMQSYIEEAFANRSSKENERTNSRVQMTKNSCE